MSLSKWAGPVHAHYFALGRPFTVDDVIGKFGNPPGTSASRSLNYAARRGWFTVVELSTGRIYRAVEQMRKTPPEASYFEGIKRVRSVFELGDNP